MPRDSKLLKWAKLLSDGSKEKSSLLDKHPDYFRLDHPDQPQIHYDCQNLYKRLKLFQETELKTTLELLLTFYCKVQAIPYKTGMHEVLAPFFIMHLTTLKAVFGGFCVFIERMMPRAFLEPSSVPISTSIFQKLLMYHEPLLANRLQSSLSNVSNSLKKWFLTGLACCLEMPQLLSLWEMCLKDYGPTFLYFFALAMLNNRTNEIINKKKRKFNKDFRLESAEDLKTISKEARYLMDMTPESFKTFMKEITVMPDSPPDWMIDDLENTAVLTCTQDDLNVQRPGLFVIDVRRLKDFKKGHLGRSFCLPLELELSIEELWTLLSGFATYYYNKNNKFCSFIFCCGEKDANRTGGLCLDVVRRGIERVSLLKGGFSNYDQDDESQRYEVCKEIVSVARESDHSVQTLLGQMWHAYLSLDHNDFSPLSTSKFSRGMGMTPDLLPRLAETVALPIKSSAECLKLMWTSNLVDTERWFENRMSQDPRCALLFAEAALLKAFLQGDNNSRDLVIERLTLVESIADTLSKKWEPQALKIYEAKPSLSSSEACKLLKATQNMRLALAVQAEATLLKSGSQLIKKKITSGSMNFRKAWKLYQKVHKFGEAQLKVQQHLNPEDTAFLNATEADIQNLVQFGKGVIILGMSMAPDSMVKLAKLLIGSSCNQAYGMQLLYNCINAKRGLRTPLALMFILFWMLIYIPDFVPGKTERYGEAMELIKFALHYYPGSPHFIWLESYMNQKQGNLERSLKLLTRVLKKTQSLGMAGSASRIEFERGWLMFLCQDWNTAIECLEAAGKGGTLTHFSLLVLGAAYCMEGDLRAAESTLEYLVNNTQDVARSDRWMCKRAARFQERRWFQLFPYEIMYVTDYLQVQKKQWMENVYDFVSALDVDEDEIEEFAIKCVLEGSLLRHLGRLREAVTALERTIQRTGEIVKEVWVVPHLYYELGMVFAKSRDWMTAASFVRKAKYFKKKYEFKRSLTYKLNAALEVIMQEETKEFKK